jgi:photosystem II stability/assembly factor-like uncharacterized protein
MAVDRRPSRGRGIRGRATFGGAKQLSFADTSHGWVATASGHLLATVDGGRSWVQLKVQVEGMPGSTSVSGVGLATDGRGCVAIYDARSPAITELRTTDGGQTWAPLDAYEQLDACARGDVGRRVAEAAQAVLRASFKPFLAFVGDSTAWAFAETGFARTSDSGTSWEEVEWPIGTSDSPAPISSSVASFGDRSNGWILTSDGSLYRTSDSGLSWSRVP